MIISKTNKTSNIAIKLAALAFRGRKNVKKEIDQVGGKDA